MKKFLSIMVSAVMLVTMLSIGAAVSAKTSVSATKIRLSNVSKGVKITWNKAKGAKKYVLKRKLSGAKKYSVIKKFKNAKAKSYTDTKAKVGKKYTYVLTAVNGGASAASESKSIIRLKAPTKIKVKAVSNDDYESYFKVTWNKSKGAKGYKVYRSVYDGKKYGKYKLVGTEKNTSYEDEDYIYSSTAGKYVKYKIAAYSGSSLSAMSAASSKSAMLDDILPDCGMNNDYTGIKISWSGSTGATGYELYRSVDNNKNYKLIKKSTKFQSEKDEILVNKYYYEDKDVSYGKTYYYYVKAYNKYTDSKGKIKDFEESFLCREYDLLLETGEDNASTVLSCLINLAESMNYGYKTSVTSDDENIVKVQTDTDNDGVKTLKLIGVNEGYTFINFISSYEDYPEISNTARIRIKVQKDPVYALELKAGESSNPSAAFKDISDTDEIGQFLLYLDNSVQIEATSEDESIVKIEGEGSDLKLTGVSAGVAKVRLKMSFKLGNTNVDILDYTFKALVTE